METAPNIENISAEEVIDFMPSEKLAGLIREQARVMKGQIGIFDQIISRVPAGVIEVLGKLLIIKVLKKPNGANTEEISLEDHRKAILKAFLEEIEGLARTTKSAAHPNASITDRNGFKMNFLRGISTRLGFPSNADPKEWSPTLLSEIREWLKSKNNKYEIEGIGTIKLNRHGRIVLEIEKVSRATY